MKKRTKQAIISGAVAGSVNGFFGAGGGIAFVPLLRRWLGLSAKEAMATSVATIFPVCVISATVYILRGHTDVTGAIPYLIGGILGGAFAGSFLKRISVRLLDIVFAGFMIYAGVRNLL